MRKYLGPVEFADLVREFRQYGYDPYNSDDDVKCWAHCKEARL